MLTFPEAVRDTIERIYGRLESDDIELRHARDERRVIEASWAAPVANAFARAELDPPGKGVGINGPGMIPALGVQLTKKLRRADEASIEAAQDAVRRSTATGYVGFMSVEAGSGIEITDTFDPVAAWELMVHNFRAGGLKRLGLPQQLRGSIERLGRTH